MSLRNGFYAESALLQLGGVKQQEKSPFLKTDRSPGRPALTWRKRLPVALSDPGLFDGISPPLTSSQTLDFADIAKICSEILGRTIVRETTSDEEYRNSLISHGLPEVMADGLGGLYKASRACEFAVVDPTLERLLGRSPKSMTDVLVDYLV